MEKAKISACEDIINPFKTLVLPTTWVGSGTGRVVIKSVYQPSEIGQPTYPNFAPCVSSISGR